MYSGIKNVQILVALLKEYGFKNVVISPGGNNIPVIHSIENDSFFKCYSVVDERSAAYFAMGLAQQLEEVVVLVCTSGTAVCNYLPGITEAHYQRVPLVIITTDRSPYMLEQLETQKIDQMSIFGPVVNMDVNLPKIDNADDEWYCQRLINEAFIELNHHIEGPVHINVPTNGGSPLDYSCHELPKVRKIRFIKQKELPKIKNELVKKLEKNKTLLIIGENYKDKTELTEMIDSFCEKFGVVCLKDYISNYNVDGILSYRITESFKYDDFKTMLEPNIVITIGNNILSNNLKYFLRNSNICHWSIDECGQIRDVFKKLSFLFECDEESFFSLFLDVSANSTTDYKESWEKMSRNTTFEELDYSESHAIKVFSDYLPNDSIVHMAILNSTRAFHFQEVSKKFKAYSNIGALGIDGCLSTFMGHSFATTKKCFLLIGDLSFFYDMNALGITGRKNNIRIMLLNNGGGAEFHFNMGINNIPTLNNYISVEHNKNAKGWAESLNYKYLCAHNKEELSVNMKTFVEDSDKPILFEVFTQMEDDASIIKNMINRNINSRSKKSMIKGFVKNILKTK